MITFFIILFFVSLGGIIFMIGRKLRTLADGVAVPENPELLEPFRLEEFGNNAKKVTRNLGYFLLVELIRLYVRIMKILRSATLALREKIHRWLDRLETGKSGERKSREPNKFLKVIGQYKRKIRKIKEEIQEEENS